MILSADAMLTRFAVDEVKGRMRFDSLEDFATIYLPETLGLFAKAHPDVELRVTCQLTRPLAEAFRADELDLIVVKQDPPMRYDGATPCGAKAWYPWGLRMATLILARLCKGRGYCH